MEFKSLFLGLTFTIGIFALKSGVGLHYFLNRKVGLRAKGLFSFTFALVYFLIFILSSHILQRINIINYFEIVQDILKSGMFIHILMAAGLIIWGIVLLKREGRPGRGSLGWVALIVPCPVCVTVIFFSAAFLVSYFPHSGYMAILCAYMGFMAITSITVLSMTLWGGRSGSTPESTLGAAMLIIAVYFFLSIIIMPQFGDIDQIYGLAAYQGEKQTVNTRDALTFYFIMVTLFITGFLAMRRKIRRGNSWT
jgi:predicted transporter